MLSYQGYHDVSIKRRFNVLHSQGTAIPLLPPGLDP